MDLDFAEIQDFVKKAHEGQLRKDGKTPYYTHPFRVADLVKKFLDKGCYDFSALCSAGEMIAAAYLHDVLEDTPITREALEKKYGNLIAYYVWWLTNQKEKAKRTTQKRMDRERLSGAPKEVKIVKLCDRLDNLTDIVNYPDIEFQKLYAEESLLLVGVLQSANPYLAQRVQHAAVEILKKVAPQEVELKAYPLGLVTNPEAFEIHQELLKKEVKK